ncbi:carbonic anhydrase [Halotalea alkalilenta]|uniref:Carbonic anhydrase n=1 Tax=Halotalea alkalilenta TaxID=376489 RepID=A0A172YG18_9GAMM|nr:carbonic anhydrase [Halotalea alkalilenta]ANF58218.1 carbonic anhydrase [Halotalea alkalilenta]
MCDGHPHKSLNIDDLLRQNRDWSSKMQADDPDFFTRLSNQQHPEFLWIGCSDSRVPANQIINVPPGEVFVHRNVANVIYHSDMNAMSAVQYAVEVLKVRHILVVGHYGCGGVQASMTSPGNSGIVDDWLHPIRDEYIRHRDELAHLPFREQADRMCEINVRMQVQNLARTKLIQRAWLNGQPLSVHGWCYSLQNGLVTDLECTISGFDKVSQLYRLD